MVAIWVMPERVAATDDVGEKAAIGARAHRTTKTLNIPKATSEWARCYAREARTKLKMMEVL